MSLLQSSDLTRTTITTHRDIPSDAPALIVAQIGQVVLSRAPVPELQEGQVLVKTEYSGVSIGTELWAATGKHDGWGEPPFVPGYQAVGEIVAIDEQSTQSSLKVGDLVACFVMGSHQRFFAADIAFAHRVERTERLSTTALFVQPCVAANALNMAGVRCGDSVLVIGQGLIGQATAQLARLRGAYVIATDVSPERLEISQAHCADRVVDASLAPPSEQIAAQFPDGIDVVIESTGFVSLLDDAMKCCRREGTFVFEGYYPDGLEFDFIAPHSRQLHAVFPCFIGERGCREAVLRMLLGASLNLQPLISDIVDWRESAELYGQLFTPSRNRLNGIIFDWQTDR